MKICYFIFACLLLTSSVWSQNWAEKGHQQFKELAYSDAIISLEKAVEKGKVSHQVYSELADSYYFNANYQASAKWYQKLFKNPANLSADYYFRYAQSMKAIGKQDKAETILEQMKSIFPTETITFYETNKVKNSGRFKIKLATFNSSASDFGPSYFGNQIVFASARDTASIFKREHSWTNQSFTDLYKVNPDSVNSKPERFSAEINSKFNESSAVFTKDGSTMYFTRNNFLDKKRGFNAEKSTLLKIYKAEKTGEKWKVIGELPFCSDNYNVAHPALSPDEKTLYFASDMPGGFGQSDLYKVEINEDGTFGTPQNLGPKINTIGRETFPFVSDKNELYFASDAHDGFGGLDIFVSNLIDNTSYSQPQNIGEPVNSRMDDFGFIINSANKTGFFSSNRAGGKGLDDIYSFEELLEMPCNSSIKGNIAVENNIINSAEIEVTLLDANSNQISTTKSDNKGNYQFDVDCAKKYTIRVSLPEYVSQEISVLPNHFATTIIDTITLKKKALELKVGDDVGKKLNLLPIYFDLSKYNIRKDAALELAVLKAALMEFPTLTIEIRSHTDSRDTFENNQLLSTQRAQSTMAWLIENGIDSTRLEAIGFGESQLLNRCSDDISCTEEEHQINRRSEFIVTGI